ncbi:hypothetical protein EV702DRAFT_1051264 [Suillus placidus]|uniref:Uncharacterized protein n=1 Tax=Suillus placidus TaxID=48579 RepID=A0A9P7CVR0_9AGAM|nr:hypothetical protein EV702DRAFT_1051264 [Suillus placidus]
MSNITPILEIEPTKIALRSWLQTQEAEVSIPMTLYDMSLRELAVQMQLQREEENMAILSMQRGQCFMEESIKVMANFCEKLNTMDNSLKSWLALQTLPMNAVGYVAACQESTLTNSDCSPPTRYKCMVWLSSCRKALLLTSSHFHDATEVDNASRIKLPDCPQYLKDHLRKFTKASCLKALIDDVAYRTYVSAYMAETKKSPVCTDNGDSFKTEHKMLDKLKFEFRVMYFKKQRAQAEVDMFAEAIARIVVAVGSQKAARLLEVL